MIFGIIFRQESALILWWQIVFFLEKDMMQKMRFVFIEEIDTIMQVPILLRRKLPVRERCPFSWQEMQAILVRYSRNLLSGRRAVRSNTKILEGQISYYMR